MSTTEATKVRYSDLRPGDVIARFDTNGPSISCGQAFVKLARRVAKGDTVTVKSVEHVHHEVNVKAWAIVVHLADGTSFKASSNQWAASA